MLSVRPPTLHPTSSPEPLSWIDRCPLHTSQSPKTPQPLISPIYRHSRCLQLTRCRHPRQVSEDPAVYRSSPFPFMNDTDVYLEYHSATLPIDRPFPFPVSTSYFRRNRLAARLRDEQVVRSVASPGSVSSFRRLHRQYRFTQVSRFIRFRLWSSYPQCGRI